MDKDYELDQIFLEARENYSQRLEKLKKSLQGISNPEFSPGMPSVKKIDLHSSGTKPQTMSLSSQDFTSPRLKFESSDGRNSKTLLVYVKNLEEAVETLRKQNEDADLTNLDLRKRLKEATLGIYTLQQSGKKQASAPEDSGRSKIHYKKKISTLKNQISQIAAEKKELMRELVESKRREQGTKDLCRAQVTEISEEFAHKLKQTAGFYKDELNKLRNREERVENEEKMQLVSEMNQLKEYLVELERVQEDNKRKNCEICEENDMLIRKVKESEKQLEEFKNLGVGLREEYDRKIEQAYEENVLRAQMNSKLSEELENKNKIITALKVELENYKIEPVIESHSKALVDQLISTNKNFANKIEKLKNENRILSSDLAKKKEILKNFEISATVCKSEIDSQKKEIERLNKSLLESDQVSQQRFKALQERFKKEMLKKNEDSQKEFQKLSDEYREMCEKLKTAQEKEDEFEFKVEILQKELNESDKAVSRLKSINSLMSNSESKFMRLGEIFGVQVRKIQTFVKILAKLVRQHFCEFQKELTQNSVDLMKYFEFGIGNMKKFYEYQIKKVKNDHSIVLISLETANQNIQILDADLQEHKSRIQTLENEKNIIQELKSTELQNMQNKYNKILEQVLDSVTRLEEEYETNYEYLIENINEFKYCMHEENKNKTEKFASALENNNRVLEFYKEKLSQIEQEKNVETNKSHSELLNLEMKLSQTLKTMRE